MTKVQTSKKDAKKLATNPVTNDSSATPVKATFALHRRYVKDSSFENPGAPMNVTIAEPDIDIAIQIAAQQSGDLYEIELTYKVVAKHEQTISFYTEVSYAGLFEVKDATREQLARFIYVEAPHLLYPHAARIVADMVRDGGLPNLTTEEPDFLTIWKLRGSHFSDDLNMTLPEQTYSKVFGATGAPA